MTPIIKDHDSEGGDMDLSSLSSSESFDPQPFQGLDSKPKTSSGPKIVRNDTIASKDLLSAKSSGTLREDDPNIIEKVVSRNAINDKTETAKSLEEKGLNLKRKAIPDYNNPAMNDPGAQFPEEYQMETDTGLVKVKTLRELNRLDSRHSIGSDATRKKSVKSETEPPQEHHDSGYDSEKLKKAIEKNKKEIENYHKHKTYVGFMSFLDKLFK